MIAELQKQQKEVTEHGEEEEDKEEQFTSVKSKQKKRLKKQSNNEFPAELRMDEYSSDEDDDNGADIGKLLVGTVSELIYP